MDNINSTKYTKCLVIGLDGATFKLLRPWVDEGELPHIGELLKSGAWGELTSTIPPITGAAWASFQTGLNPGRHGLFDWLTRKEHSYQLRPISSRMIRRRTLWEFISSRGGQVGVIGVPVTYPHREVNGFLISGLLTPKGANYTYPEELARQLERAVGRFPCMPEHWRGRYQVRDWLAGLKRSVKLRRDVASYLMQRYNWDFFMLHFMETDSVQHQMWHTIDGRERPRYRLSLSPLDKLGESPILEIYRLVDEAIGELMSSLTDEVTVILISDHGFGPLYYNVYINNWLLEHGYLKLKRDIPTWAKRLFFKVGITQENLFPLAERLGILKQGALLKHDQIHNLLGRFFISAQNIDWRRTKAYSYGNIGQIYLNLKGREPEGSVEPQEADALIKEIISKLKGLMNPERGEAVIDEIYRKEEIYWGEKLHQAPEILFLPKDGYMTLGVSEFPSNRVISHAFAGSGWHDMRGIFIGAGKNLKPGEVKCNLHGMEIIDLFPTILYAMGLPIPKDLDGRVFEEIFVEDYLTKNEVVLLDEGGLNSSDSEKAKADWEKEIRERLKGMGYV